ncbi:hypothetical protein AAP_04357 [Ascosphaera apis ARSEF 7405]|uniref:Uncharacterized protein n=1 Tax=Ascosphaera apis ARSEF 7405 TaxID=392613 RepID=A0A167X402_9EURO|nr:hypothetical protein AAP_04357 [Ascosphaera apis ARSEF 7405]
MPTARGAARTTTDEQIASQINKELESSIDHESTIRLWDEHASSEFHAIQAETPTRSSNARPGPFRNGAGPGAGFSMLVDGSKRKAESSQAAKLQRPMKTRKVYGKSKALEDLYKMPSELSSNDEDDEIRSQPAEPEDVPLENAHQDDTSNPALTSRGRILGALSGNPFSSDGSPSSSADDEEMSENIELMGKLPEKSDQETAQVEAWVALTGGAKRNIKPTAAPELTATEDPDISSELDFPTAEVPASQGGEEDRHDSESEKEHDAKSAPNLNSQSQASDARQLLLEANIHQDIEISQISESEESVAPNVPGAPEEPLKDQELEEIEGLEEHAELTRNTKSPVRHRKRRRHGDIVEETPEAEDHENTQEPTATVSRLPAQEDSESEEDSSVPREGLAMTKPDQSNNSQRNFSNIVVGVPAIKQDVSEEQKEEEEKNIFDIYKNRRNFKVIINQFDRAESAWQDLISLTRRLSLEQEASILTTRSRCITPLYNQLANLQEIYDDDVDSEDPVEPLSEDEIHAHIRSLMDEVMSQTRTLEFEDEAIVSPAVKSHRKHSIPILAEDLSLFVFPAFISVAMTCLLYHFNGNSIDSQGLSYAHDLLGYAYKIADRLRPSNFRSAKIRIHDRLRSHRRCLPQLQEALFEKMAKARLEEAYRKNLEERSKVRRTSPQSDSEADSDADFEPLVTRRQTRQGRPTAWKPEEEDTLLEGLYRYRNSGESKYKDIQRTFVKLQSRSIPELKEKAQQMSHNWVLLNEREGTQLDQKEWGWLLDV